jgi:hypothetical protein
MRRITSQRARAGEASLLLHRNYTFVPLSEPGISIYGRCSMLLNALTGAGVGFHSHTFSNPASRSAKMPAAFLIASDRDLGAKTMPVRVYR